MAEQSNNGTGEGQGAEGTGTSEEQVTLSAAEFKKITERAQRLEGALKEKEVSLQKFTSIYKDIDPEEHRTLKEELAKKEREAAKNDPAKAEELHARALQRIRDEYEGKLKPLGEELEKVRRVNKTLAVTDKVMGEIGKHFNDDAVKFIKREVEERCDIDEEGQIVVKDGNGEQIYRGARPLTVKEFGEMLMNDYPSLARPTSSGGAKDATSGTKTTGSRNGRVPQSWAELQAMGPQGKEVFDRMKKEDPEGVKRILGSMSLGR